MSVWNRTPESPERIVVQLLGATAVIWLMAEVAWNRWGITGGVAFVGLSTSLLVGADQLLGAPFSVSALISYSPLMALRFYGLGNEGAAVLVGSTLIGMTFLLEIVHADTVRVRVATIAAGVAVVSLAALPFFGANIIVGVWGTVTFAAFLVSSQRRRATWRDLVLAGATSAAVVALTALLDRFTGSGTHVARAIDDVAGGGLPALVITRLTTALAIFTSSPLPAVVLVIMLGFLYACLRPHGRMAAAFAAYPLLRAAFVATLAGGVVGTVVEDSGLVILGLCIMYLAAPLVLVMLQPERDSRGAVS